MNKPKLALVSDNPTPEQASMMEAEFAEDAYIAPEMLHTVLRRAANQVVTFHAEKALKRYRSRLYSINKDGIRRYRTMRCEDHMYGIIIYRLK